MGYDHAMFGFSPCGPYWRDVRKLASVELLSNRQLELLNHVRDSEVKLFIKELYGQWIQNGDRPVLVEMKEKCWHLAANVMLGRWIRCWKLGSWVDEHRRKRFSGSMNEAEQDFNHVMLSVIEDGQFSDHDHDTVIKATFLVCFFFFPWSNSMNLHTVNSKPPS
ncbi:Cytochrome P450 CYP82H23 [Vitis vinifera]|uniref:Cytochrome P450 CYP82H23 n=1 Tax=Vitis vinifera TaxID=29760 RepID=A0A438CAZ3_VITVI|nr:Cytochrome P450 CYP82H23 [Vitis vinifera]